MTTSYTISDGPKMLRETLCVAQSILGAVVSIDRRLEHNERLQRLLDECDRHRPIGPDGKHGDLHTETCGCEGVMDNLSILGPFEFCENVAKRIDHDAHKWTSFRDGEMWCYGYRNFQKIIKPGMNCSNLEPHDAHDWKSPSYSDDVWCSGMGEEDDGVKEEEIIEKVNHPSHYNQYKGLEIIDLVEQMNFNRGNAVKYISRAGFKGGRELEIEDLRKAAWYLNREIERLGG